MKKFSRLILPMLAVVSIAGVALGSVFLETRTEDALLPGASMSMQLFSNTSICDKIGTYTKFGNADSCTWRLYYSDDGVNWTLIDTTIVKVAADTTQIQSSPNWGAVARRQLAHTATVGANNTVHFDGFIYPYMYVSVTNNAVVDTASFTIGLLCGTEGR